MSEDIECPHCGVYASVGFEQFQPRHVLSHKKNAYPRVSIEYGHCPSKACQRLIVRAMRGGAKGKPAIEYAIPAVTTVKITGAVDPDIVSQYRKAKRILPIDHNASAAMSRRCLQMLLHKFFRIKKDSLKDEIQALLDSKQLPTYLAADIDRIREIGNFGAHPAKGIALPDNASRGEAEWSLDILEDLFEHIAGREKSKRRNEQFDRDHPKKNKPGA